VRLFVRSLLVFVFFTLSFAFFAPSSFAATTPFRSANIVTTEGSPPYTNLSNCSSTDGLTCDRAMSGSYAHLYFRDFGTYTDFGMSEGSTITKLRIRITGKTSNSVYVGLSLEIPFTGLCQFPSDLWTTYQLPSQVITVQNFTTNVGYPFLSAYCLQADNLASRAAWHINFNGFDVPWSANIDNFEIAFDYDPGATPTPTPSPTPTPTPTHIPGPAPFLDLPWDYGGKGLSFSEAALAMTSYFDHSYPLLSANLLESTIFLNQITTFRNENSTTKNYSSHDGYDYAKVAKVNISDPVLAAASGIATYINSCGSCGNMILIDHGNGYQTRYMHLQKDGLITSTQGAKVSVNAKQQIGLVGATGNVNPSGDLGGHIHFGVFEDKNKDGNFEDNVPDGVTDPFGWQSKSPDPWAIYTFFYNGQNRTGNKSYYLWTKKIDNLDATLTSNGGVFNNGRYKIDFPKDATNQNLILNILSEPIAKLSKEVQSIGSAISVVASDLLGNIVTKFQKQFNLKVDFSAFDLSKYNTDTLSIYSSTDGQDWTKEPTIIDYVTKSASAQISHLTHFALMAERKDTISPTTNAVLEGLQGQPSWFRSDVKVTLDAKDNDGGLGVDYTLYKIETNENTTDWTTYKTPLTFAQEGHHKVQFYSVDKGENIESVKSVKFDIDKTIPEAKIQFDTNAKDLVISGVDNSGYVTVDQTSFEKNKEQFILTDKAGNYLTLVSKDREHDKEAKLSLESLTYSNNATVTLDKNKLYVEYSLDKDNIKELEQKFEIKDEIKIKIRYDSKKNQSTIVTKQGKKEKLKEIKVGLILLQITTEKGTLKYSY